MKEYYERLMFVLARMPDCNTAKNRAKLSNFLAEYEAILGMVNKTAGYSNRTNIFYSRMNGLQRNLYQAKQAKTEEKQALAFFNAVTDLQSDLRILANIIKTIDGTFD